jgi:hypothetical protein
MELDLRELVFVERARLPQDRIGYRELAHVVQQSPDRETAQPCRRETESLAHLDREGSDAASVLLRRRVFLGQSDHQRANASAEVGLLRRHDLDGAQVARKRTRAATTVEVEHGRRTDHCDPDHLEEVPEPPSEVHEGEHESPVQRRPEKHQPEHDREVSHSAGQQERVRSADRECREQHQTDRKEE